MESRFVIPVLVSTALHALVFLFGNGRTHEPVPPPIVAVLAPLPPPAVPVDNEEYTPPDPASDTEAEKVPRGSVESPPRGPEPDTEARGPIAIDIPRTAIAPTTRIVDFIPALGPGDPNGDESVTAVPNVIGARYLDHTPRTRSQARPDYPLEARKLGLSAEVTLEFVVDETGRVLNPRVVRSTDSRFDSNAVRAVERWRFEPGKKDGRVVAFRMVVPILFSVKDE